MAYLAKVTTELAHELGDGSVGPRVRQLALLVVAVAVLMRQLPGSGAVAARHAAVAKRKRAARDARRAQLAKQLPAFADVPNGPAIVGMGAVELAAAIREKRLTCVEVMTAFCARALQAGEALNSNAEECFDEALEEARKCDEELQAGKLRGPLHGVPFSVKDQVDQKGYDSTCGMAAKLFAPRPRDAAMVTILRAAGAIPHVRSNVPQSLMLAESNNAFWGEARNPFDVARTPGGSSGGEGALISVGASPLGIGTDIGGSIRIPAAFCGVVGFKPTPSRMTGDGITSPKHGEHAGPHGMYSVLPTAGPLGRTVADCEMAMRLWCEQMHKDDVTLPPLGWNAATATDEKRKLRFGVLRTDGVNTPCPGMDRAFDAAVAGLRAAGHEVEEVAYDFSFTGSYYIGLVAAEGRMRSYIDGLEGEPLTEAYGSLRNLVTMTDATRYFLDCVLSLLPKMRRTLTALRAGYTKSAYELQTLQRDRDDERKKLLDFWAAKRLDALLCPGLGLPAFPHKKSSDMMGACAYTFLWNLMHLPAGVVPATYIKENEQHYPPSAGGDAYDKHADASMKSSAGLPLALQVVALPFQDELCLKAMRDVEKALEGTWQRPELRPETVELRAPRAALQ